MYVCMYVCMFHMYVFTFFKTIRICICVWVCLRPEVVAGNKRASEDGKESPKVDVQLVMATATLTKAVRALLDDVSAVRAGDGVKVLNDEKIMYVCMYGCV